MMLSLGHVIMDSPLCPGSGLDPASGSCVSPKLGLQISDQGSGIDTAAGMVNTIQTLPGVPDAGTIQSMVGAGAPGLPISSGIPIYQPPAVLTTWILPGIIGAVAIYALWAWRR